MVEEEFLTPLRITKYKLAKRTDGIVSGKRGIMANRNATMRTGAFWFLLCKLEAKPAGS
jgi:hypothetical protein